MKNGVLSNFTRSHISSDRVSSGYEISYADDSQLYLSFNPSYAFSKDETIRPMESCISYVEQWITSENLIFDGDKSEFNVIASRHILKNVICYCTVLS